METAGTNKRVIIGQVTVGTWWSGGVRTIVKVLVDFKGG